ncbi:MAG: hypothetical protein FD152_2110 [Xanthobacteraceae bacterium]|nr:MAG: hypothetical protein FD152_2110 [Xanthobacteraceae bacterium]
MSYGSLYSGSVSRLITLTNGAATVDCSGTVLTEEDLRALDTLAVGTGQVVKIASITDDDTFELLRPWAGATQTLISTWDIIRDAPSRLDQVEAASAMTQAAGFAALVNGQTRQFRVESEGNSPPVSPVDGKYYLAGSAPTGWPITVTSGDILKRRLGSYGVITPEEGWLAVILATGVVKRFKSGAWGIGAVTAADVAFTPTGGVAATTVQEAIAEVDSEKMPLTYLDTDGALAANSDTKVASQKAVKTYADTKVTKASGTTAGRLWRFTDTAGGLGQSQMSEDGSGNVTMGGALSLPGNLTTARSDPNTVWNIITNTSTGASVGARLFMSTGTANSWAGYQLYDNSGSPYIIEQSGSAVSAKYTDFPLHVWRSQAGVERMRLDSNADLHLNSSALGKTFPGKAVLINAPTAADYAGFDLFTAGTYRARFIASDAAALLDSALGLSILFRPGGSATLTMLASRTISGVPFTLPSYTVATVPSASAMTAGTEIFVTNEAGGAVPAFSDGTNWRRVTDRAVIS